MNEKIEPGIIMNGLFVLSPGPSGAGQDELSQLGRKASLDASHPQTDEESPPLQGGALQTLSLAPDHGSTLKSFNISKLSLLQKGILLRRREWKTDGPKFMYCNKKNISLFRGMGRCLLG